MVVGQKDFDAALAYLLTRRKLALDTETFGLRPYHGDRLFSIIIADDEKVFYFNFKPYPGLSQDFVLTTAHLQAFKPLFANPDILWFLHNAKYDKAILANEGLFLAGTIHCTRVGGRVLYNEYFNYDLDSSLERIGLRKDDTVERYIEEHKLYEIKQIPGKKTKKKNKFYDRVPFDIIVPYGCRDGSGTFALGCYQEREIQKADAAMPEKLPTLYSTLQRERRLTKTVFNMERTGILIDREYTVRAARYENDRSLAGMSRYKALTGKVFKNSNKDFQEVFASEKSKWVWGEPTEKTGQINPSFESEVLIKFENPAAKEVLLVRDAKSRVDFLNGFLYHMDARGYIHPNFNSDGTRHGRFSSSDPNFQNLRNSDEDDQGELEEYPVRRAIIPPPGFILFMPDYSTLEYKFALELACRFVGFDTTLAKKVRDGLDYHQATADLGTATGVGVTRPQAKTVNFLTLYGGGNEKLAADLKCSVETAAKIRGAIKAAAPEITQYVRAITQTAERRGWIFNAFGRRCYFPDRNFAYKATNYAIAGGCADLVKEVMNRIDDYLSDKKSKLIMTVHDELPIIVHESEVATVPREIVRIMETTWESKYVPLTVGVEWSDKSLADGVKGFPA